MVSVMATVQIESVFDLFLRQGWTVSAHGDSRGVSILLTGDGQSREGAGATFAEAYLKVIEQEQANDGVSADLPL